MGISSMGRWAVFFFPRVAFDGIFVPAEPSQASAGIGGA